jgi:hypothetical protein
MTVLARMNKGCPLKRSKTRRHVLAVNSLSTRVDSLETSLADLMSGSTLPPPPPQPPALVEHQNSQQTLARLGSLHNLYTTVVKDDGSGKNELSTRVDSLETSLADLMSGSTLPPPPPQPPASTNAEGYARLERTSDERESNRASRSFRSVSTCPGARAASS